MNAGPEGKAAALDQQARATLAAFLVEEGQRCQRRRRALFGTPDRHHRYTGSEWREEDGNWALALSGGGIHSSTFCLGVLQALAQPLDDTPGPRSAVPDQPELQGLLPRFDYVSSVSGGGFVAGFFQSLFAPKPALAGAMPSGAAVYGVIAEEPPGRVHSHITPTPLAWLRENGRYLAPSGAGDMAYAFAFSVRNWIALHCVIGVMMVFFASLLEIVELLAPRSKCPSMLSWWLPSLVVGLVWLIPAAGAYWIARSMRPAASMRALGGRLLLVTVIGIVLLRIEPSTTQIADALCSAGQHPAAFGQAWQFYLMCIGAVMLLSAAWVSIACFLGASNSIAQMYVTLTQCFLRGIQCLGALLALAVVMASAHRLVYWTWDYRIIGVGGVGGGLAAAYRMAAKLLPRVQGSRNGRENMRGLNSRALYIGLGVLAIVLVYVVAVFWMAVTLWLVRPCIPSQLPPVFRFSDDDEWHNAIAIVLLAAGLALAIARWPAILNIAGFHYFYSARITRAYLGAANPERTSAPPGPVANDITKSTAEPEPGDFVSYANYHKNPVAPLHLINITLNQTIDPREQLVQRDRKGLPFTVLPGLDPVFPGLDPVPLGSIHVSIGDRHKLVNKAGADLTIGDWLAISGAAVASGMGRQTSFGASISVTFANVRIGRWWPQDEKDRWRLRLVATYAYLWSELSGKFFGPHRQYLYLTDGAHFDNTAIYELLRRVQHPATAVKLIFMCDCGADREYRYDDVANLVRLARIDFGLEIEVDHGVTQPPNSLASVFGTPDCMGPADPEHLDTRCALLLNVRLNGRVLARIVVIKPRLISSASSDLLSYFRNNPIFPQEPTSDQFFDEQQWESYRKLGFECCKAVLGIGAPLWHTVLR